tara:strand:+ start:875 stop:1912 length:1038 start_codon:yes stop_codon:yes gene_type:complete
MIGIITDQHFGLRKGSQIFHDYMERFYADVFFPNLKKSKIKTLLDLGDTFDNRKNIDFWSLSWAKEKYFDILADMGITVYSLVGNHTAYYKNTLNINTVDLLLNHYDNIHCIEKPSTLNIEGLDICFIPWICMENEGETFEEIDNTKAEICMGHLELKGFEAHPGFVMDHGLSYERFDKFKKVFSGHFHTRSSNGNISYLGNPYQVYWNDYGESRGFHLFNTKTRRLKFIENPYRMFDKIFYDDSVNDYECINVEQYKDKFIKLIVENKDNYCEFDNFIERLYNVGIHELKIIDNTVQQAVATGDIEIEGTLKFLENYIDKLDYQNKDSVKSIVNSIYSESIQLE